MNAPKLPGQRRDSLAVAVRPPGRSGLGNGVTDQGKRHVERRRCGAANDVSADSQPVRRQVRVPDPSLQVPREHRPGRRHDRPRRRQVQEMPTRHQDLRAEEIVTGRQKDRGVEGDGDLDLFATRWALAAGSLIRNLVDAVDHGVQDREAPIQQGCVKKKRSQASIARGGSLGGRCGTTRPRRY